MRFAFSIIITFCFCANVSSQSKVDTRVLLDSLDRATAEIRRAFAVGDAALVGKLHSQDVIKYFGGDNVIIGRAAVEKSASDWFRNSKVEFVENNVENTEFFGNVAIQTVIFTIRTTPKSGGESSLGRGRSMVIYVQDKSSPTGWLTVREIAQEAPAQKN